MDFLKYKMLSYCFRGSSGLGSSGWDHWLRQVLTRIFYKQMILQIHSEPVLGEPNVGGGGLWTREDRQPHSETLKMQEPWVPVV